jgi:predicted AlkP superfamily pyrophosphatase or phosphodiesterase
MSRSRRAVFVCCDGLGRNWVTPARTPVLCEVASRSLWCADHRAIFPSATRASAASVATGCYPARHGLHGNRMGLIQGGRIAVRDVGSPVFRTQMREATGGTLRVPTLAERVADAGGFFAFSNVSPGAAYFLDPESFGFVYHRAGSYAPGGNLIARRDALDVTHDLAGDWVMTQRFCSEVLCGRKACVSVLWLANPDLTLHGAPLGSPEHHAALAATERCVRAVIETVDRLRAAGESILLLIGSDHGQETIGDYVAIEEWLESRGLGGELANGQIAVATQGTAALLYATNERRSALIDLLDAMRAEPWADEVVVEDGLVALGHAASGGVVAAVNMGRREDENAYGVPGVRWVAAAPGTAKPVGFGQHGGWGADETRPFLLLNGADIRTGVHGRTSSLVDIAPTILAFLGLPIAGLDGAPLAELVP